MTDAERKLWQKIRAHRLNGLSFRRQVPIGAFIVDFVCHDHHLVIELDGGQHADADAALHDAARELWLQANGYRILRFWNSDVLGNLDGVQQSILDAIATPLPNPPPQGGRGQIGTRGNRKP